MNTTEARNAIQAHFDTGWSPTPDVPVLNDNVEGDTSGDEFVRLAVNFNGGEQAGLGGPGAGTWHHYGIVYVQIFVEAGSGPTRSQELADLALGLFRGKRLGDVTFNDVSVRTIGRDGKWHQTNVVAPFQVFEAL